MKTHSKFVDIINTLRKIIIPGLDSIHMLPQPEQEHMDTTLEDEMER